MVQRSGQTGVPVITVDNEVIVGFDRRRLEQLLSQPGQARPGGRPSLGLKVADARAMAGKVPWLAGRSGAYVGGANPGSPGATAGIAAGDLIVAVEGRAIAGTADLEREVASGRRQLALTVANLAGTRQVVVSL